MSSAGNAALWIGFAFFVTASVIFWLLSSIRNVRSEARFLYYLVTAINAIAALAYLIMALGDSSMTSHITTRQVEWIRYAAWALQAPLTVTVLGLLAGQHWTVIAWTSLAALLGIGAGFAGALSTGYNATWPLFAFGVMCGVPVASALLGRGRASAYKVHVEIGKLYDVLAFGSVLLYIGYVIVWACAEGSNIMTTDQELIVYTVLDITAKVVFGFTLLFAREAIARYGSFLGGINTGVTYDFPIPASTTAGSATNYSYERVPQQIVFGEHRDLTAIRLTADQTGVAPLSGVSIVKSS